jgi:hypothetical protein
MYGKTLTVPCHCARDLNAGYLQDLCELTLLDVDPKKLPLLLGGIVSARRTLHTLQLKFIEPTISPHLPLALEYFSSLTYVHHGIP